ncbi:AI-2E family transporter [Nakamurella endophytica]|uniref:AI-2E family transporter n=1 Tax=Nakamurella endophytica TaxID=1748367 RepID=A0A917SVS9_9ACTN|nr:AI-2E family transporter [Nakamurella endophytica]GGM01073.1 hypothetical protein GCM10011594_21420 [Nakamurella endophytica]
MSAVEHGGGPDDGDDRLVKALDEALIELDRADGRTPAGGPPADAAALRQRRAGLRTVLSTVGSRVTAERSARAHEAAEAAMAAVAAARAIETDGDRESHRSRTVAQPFRIGFLAGLGLILAYITFLVVDSLQSTLIVIAVAAILAIGLDPAVGWLVRRGLRRGLAVTAVFLGMLIALAGAAYAIIPPIVTEVSAFITSVPSLLERLQDAPTIKNLDAKFGIIQQLQNSDFIKNLTGGAASTIVSVGVTVAGIAGDLFVCLVLALFFLAGFPRIKAGAFRLAPASRRARVTDLGEKILKQMGGYLAGATIVAIQAGVVAGLFAAVAGLPYPWAIALGAALLDFVPVVGPIIVGLSMTLIGLSQSLTLGIVAAAFYVCQHLFEAYWLYPRVMRRQVDISTLAVVLAILIGGALLGVTGALLAVPVAAGVQLIMREVVMPMQERH